MKSKGIRGSVQVLGAYIFCYVIGWFQDWPTEKYILTNLTWIVLTLLLIVALIEEKTECDH